MMSKRKYLIIGAGPAAFNAAKKIRARDQDAEIVMVSREEGLPYSPAVLPYLVSGRTIENNIWLANEEQLRKMGVTFVRGKKLVKLNPNEKQVVYQDGSTDKYDLLLLATGAEALPTGFAVDVLTLRNLDDYHQLNGQLDGAKDVTILGAGMIAVELAVALVERGNRVNIIGRGRPLRAQFDAQAGNYINDILTGHGIQITTGKSVTAVKKQRSGIEIQCADGDIFNTSLLVSCLGVRPGLSFANGSGMSVNQGILVDSKMRTNIEDVYAAGDVAEAPSFSDGHPGVSAILPNAIAQGKIAGANMAGEDSSYAGWIPMNLLKFFGSSAFSVGETTPADGSAEVLEAKDDRQRCFKRLIIRDNKLIGAMIVNVAVDPGVIVYLIRNRVALDTYREQLFERPQEVSRRLMIQVERSGITAGKR